MAEVAPRARNGFGIYALLMIELDAILADPPLVHPDAADGVWRTSRSCYEYLLRVAEGAVTLETGLGASTVIFAQRSLSHTCVVHSVEERDRLCAYATERGILLDRVAFEIGSSTDVLPGIDGPATDVLFIDGGHGFPTPIVDWFYAGRHLKVGGVVVIDDIQLPHVANYLVRFLHADPRWTQASGDSNKWIAFRKNEQMAFPEEWESQPFLGAPHEALQRRLKRRVYRHLVRPLKR